MTMPASISNLSSLQHMELPPKPDRHVLLFEQAAVCQQTLRITVWAIRSLQTHVAVIVRPQLPGDPTHLTGSINNEEGRASKQVLQAHAIQVALLAVVEVHSIDQLITSCSGYTPDGAPQQVACCKGRDAEAAALACMQQTAGSRPKM